MTNQVTSVNGCVAEGLKTPTMMIHVSCVVYISAHILNSGDQM